MVRKNMLINRFYLLGFASLLLALVVSALGGCGDRKIQTGRFLDSAVEGLTYSTPTVSGVTNETGDFQYRSGESVTFQLHELTLGEATGDDVITPLDLVEDATDVTNDRVTNIARLLQSLDENDNPDDGIRLPSSITAASNGGLDLGTSQDAFEASPGLSEYLEAVKGEGARLISISEAQEHLRDTIDDNSSSDSLTFNAGNDRDVSQGSTVTLTGEIDGDFTDFSWEPDPNNDFNITLTDSSSNSNLSVLQRQFVAPEVSEVTELVFIFTVVAADGTSDTDEVTITVTL